MDKGFKEPAGGLMIVSEFAIRICPQSPQLATDAVMKVLHSVLTSEF